MDAQRAVSLLSKPCELVIDSAVPMCPGGVPLPGPTTVEQYSTVTVCPGEAYRFQDAVVASNYC